MSKYTYKDSGYKKRLKEEAEKEAVKAKKAAEEAYMAGRIFLDDSNSIEDRMEAAKRIGSFSKDEDIQMALEIFKNKDYPEKLRAYALSSIANQAFTNEEIMKEAISALKAGEGSGQISIGAMTILQMAEISSPTVYENNSADYKDALRSVIEHDNKNLRSSALEILALDRDDYTQRRLIESLENKGKEIIEPEVAIQLLSYDLHADHFSVLRKIAQDAPSPAAKKEAIRNLGPDEKAKDLLVEVIANGKEDPETRHAAATALHCLHPQIATEQSKKIIVEEEGEHLDELKTALLNTLIFLEQEPDKSKDLPIAKGVITESIPTDDFVEKLDSIKGSSKSTEYNQMIDLYLNMKKG